MPAEAAVRADPATLPPLPAPSADQSLFLDFDGTLVELAARPDAVAVTDRLTGLLAALAERLDGRVAIVSGRSVAQLDALLGETAMTLAVAGSHGAERRLVGGPHLRPEAGAALAEVAAGCDAFAAADAGIVVERKSLGVALHYRLAPHLAQDADALAEALAAEHGLVMQRGKMMAEVRVAGDKGVALDALMAEPPFAGSVPMFFGDDVTDEDGFAAAAAHGGAGVLIGPARPTAAGHRLADVAALHAWLRRAAGMRP